MTQNYGLYQAVTQTQALFLAGAISYRDMCVQNQIVYATHMQTPLKKAVVDPYSVEFDDADFQF